MADTTFARRRRCGWPVMTLKGWDSKGPSHGTDHGSDDPEFHQVKARHIRFPFIPLCLDAWCLLINQFSKNRYGRRWRKVSIVASDTQTAGWRRRGKIARDNGAASYAGTTWFALRPCRHIGVSPAGRNVEAPDSSHASRSIGRILAGH